MATKAPKKINPIKVDAMQTKLAKMINARSNFVENVDNEHVFISTGNRKTGFAVPSVSLIPVADCRNCSTCSRLCYDLRNDMYPGTMQTRAKNSAIARTQIDKFFFEISLACGAFKFFRWHVGGDILNGEYFEGMVKVALQNPGTTFLAFTKCYDIVNDYVAAGYEIPSNFQIIFSDWPGANMCNPFDFPTSSPVFADGTTAAKPNAIECGGNCSECAIMGAGCWTLKKGEGVKFNAH